MSVTIQNLPAALWKRAVGCGAPESHSAVAQTEAATGLANMAVRGLTLASRAVLVVFFARFLTPAELGLYGLFTVTIGLVLYLLGFDFYNYAMRELLGTPRERWPAMLRDQGVFHLVAYGLVLPGLVALFCTGLLPWAHAAWFYVLLVLEHIGQELYRLLLADSRSLLANVAYFLRAGAWVFVYVGIGLRHPEARRLSTVWMCWAAGGACGIGIAASAFARLPWRSAARTPVDYAWIRRGLRISARLLTGTIALWGITTFDRYLLRHYCGIDAVGVYSFYMSVGNAIVGFVDAGVVSPLYPALVSAANGDGERYARLRNRFSVSVWGAALAFAAAAALGIRPVLRFVGRAAYSQHIGIFWLVLAYTVISLASRPATYALYARRRDNLLVATAVLGLLTLVIGGPALAGKYQLTGLALGVCVSMSVVALGRVLCERWGESR